MSGLLLLFVVVVVVVVVDDDDDVVDVVLAICFVHQELYLRISTG